MSYVTIKYNEGNKKNLGYISVDYHNSNDEIKSFSTGNFVKDWFDMRRYMINEDSPEYVSQSSTVDHFIMDGAPYDTAYLHITEEKPILKYLDRSDSMWFITQADVCEKGIEFFVPENTQPTWEELKEMCK